MTVRARLWERVRLRVRLRVRMRVRVRVRVHPSSVHGKEIKIENTGKVLATYIHPG